MKKGKQIIVALDFPHLKSALDFAEQLDPLACRVKIGKELFTASGPACIESFQKRGFDVFLDLKFHDIPNTVSRSVEAAIKLGVWMLNVHSLGGKEMLKAAYKTVENSSTKPLLIGVTVLTSLEDKDIERIGLQKSTREQVLLLAQLCQNERLDGVVCSPKELSFLRESLDKDFVLVTPGIRSIKSKKDDQLRTSTALEAVNNGADYIVIGREITNNKNPNEKIHQILKEFQQIT